MPTARPSGARFAKPVLAPRGWAPGAWVPTGEIETMTREIGEVER